MNSTFSYIGMVSLVSKNICNGIVQRIYKNKKEKKTSGTSKCACAVSYKNGSYKTHNQKKKKKKLYTLLSGV